MHGLAALLILQASLFTAQAPALPNGRAGARAESRAADTAAVAGPVALPTANSAMAVRALRPPAMNAREDDPVWQAAPPITQFVEWNPTEGKAPRFRTVAKVAYDAAHLYVLVRCYDPHPDSIIRILERRDTFTPSDMVWLFVDPYHDRRTGYEFGVNAAGVKIDQAIYNGGNEDNAWDAVWDAVTRVDSLGWVAEFRIPMSQLHYAAAAEHTFGFTIDRDIYRYNERVSWPMLSQSRPDITSQLGTLTGLDGLDAPKRLEAAPYLVTKNASTIANDAFSRASYGTLGADLKYRVASNLTLHATVNPDFGEVESDPSVLNLTAFETFFDERRPFFVAGRGLFQVSVNCSSVNCSNEELFYSRRIGRTPQLWGTFGDTTPASPTRILGAGKLVGRFPGGLTLGVLDAVTQRDQARFGDTLKTVEPATNFAVVRVTQDLRQGATTLGAMVTGVNRGVDAFTAPYLARDAYVGAVDFRHRFLANTYEVSGGLAGSRVAGSDSAITAIETDAVHFFQRPDAGLPLDSSRTSLSGDAEELHVSKVGGQHLLFETAYMRRSAGFEINDLGYLQRADQQTWATWAGFFDRHARSWYNRLQWNFNWWQNWTTAGLPQEAAANSNVHVTFRNNMQWNLGATWGQLGTTYDDRGARGGPAIRQDPYFAPWLNLGGDDRKALVPYLNVNYFRGDAGHNSNIGVQPELDLKLARRFSSSLNVSWNHNVADNQWFNNYTDSAGTTHYTFAHLDQTTVAVTLRLNYTFTPDLSLQVYAQPFVSKGTYSNIRQLSATPRAASYDARYAAYGDTAVTNNPGGFDYQAFQSNVVLRWEYRPGSTLFVVWNEGRQGSTSFAGDGGYQTDIRDLFRLHPANTFLVKWSYWLDW
jgi:Domain of unknown function (DUF5916)/Carbohydrate family 9 binding domain-like